ncbi:hypothetical protein MPC4_200065 [Methylocella tundrae]|uniref:Uncharacterized protein n=1 Tax=Methylocella tundrae TaxID=227605 RepID=A0A8B6M598_METTU|nr:hypothetical protein MPC1_3740003 [Methylocella tundrae]VTZ50181.1 hypothetical protein MPC4_200065 [Methylocella tundrae]
MPVPGLAKITYASAFRRFERKRRLVTISVTFESTDLASRRDPGEGRQNEAAAMANADAKGRPPCDRSRRGLAGPRR